jgi:four helix bundle protein
MGAPHLGSFDELDCWQYAHALAVECYRLANGFPTYERYALAAQLRRAAASVPANIAEGFGRSTPRDYTRSLFIARGSLFETESHLRLARDVGHLTVEDVAAALDLRAKAGRTLNGLISTIRRRAARSIAASRSHAEHDPKPPTTNHKPQTTSHSSPHCEP